MRNSGWYIPYWRKPKKKGKAGAEEIIRSDEDLEAVRRRWIERYRRTVHALMLMGLSVGSNRSDVQARYEELRATGTIPARDLEDAYQHLMRVLAPLERRKRRRASTQATTRRDAAHTNGDVAPAGEDGGADVDEPNDELLDGADEEAADDEDGEDALTEGAPGTTSASSGPASSPSSAADEATDGP